MPTELPVAPEAGTAPRRSLLSPLRDNLGTGSVIFRHALRLGIAAALATALTRGLGLNHGYWVIITVIVVLQPYAGLTLQRGLQRAAGTLLGAALAAGLVVLVKDPGVILLAIVVLFAVAISVQPLSLSAFQVLLTPALVLLAELQTGDWELAGVRLVNTVLGAVLALLCSRLLWPSPESLRFPEQVASTLRAARDYLREVATARSDAEPAVREARRRLGLELLSVEASFQRLLAEWRGPARQLEPVMALLGYTRRFSSAVTALAASRRLEGAPDCPRWRATWVACWTSWPRRWSSCASRPRCIQKRRSRRSPHRGRTRWPTPRWTGWSASSPCCTTRRNACRPRCSRER
ncbi:FUSC family protein, partial [Pyxidicoccus sp. 3LG]